ncbi:MAG: hypothetical protein KJ915_11150 [Candidatus Omnitrophica bacterium]|nr:hypothetical protein [Candidatus Omnitrophota bacterium]
MSKRQDNQKVTYEIDPYNRLIINKAGKKSKISRFRQVLDGRFKINSDDSEAIVFNICTDTVNMVHLSCKQEVIIYYDH